MDIYYHSQLLWDRRQVVLAVTAAYWWGLGGPGQDGSPAHLHSCKVMLAVGGRTQVLLVQVAAQGLLECPSDMVAAISQSEQSKTARQKWQCHLLGSHTPSLLHCSADHPDLPYSLWEGTVPRHGCQRHGLLGAILKAGCHSVSIPYFILPTCSVHSPSKDTFRYNHFSSFLLLLV